MSEFFLYDEDLSDNESTFSEGNKSVEIINESKTLSLTNEINSKNNNTNENTISNNINNYSSKQTITSNNNK